MFFLFWLSHSFFIGLGAAVQTYTARQIGQLNNGLCDPLRIGLKLTFSLSLIVTLIVLLFSDTLFTALIPDIDVKNEAQSYFNWRIWGLSALSLNIIYRAFYNGVKSPYFYLSVLLGTHILNIFLNYGFIFGKMGFPKLAISGAALASTISLAFGTIAYTILTRLKFKFRIRILVTENLSLLKKIITLGFPLGLQELTFASAFMAFTWIVGMLGYIQVAIANVIVTLIIFIWCLSYSFSVTTQTLVSEAFGQSNKSQLLKGVNSSTKVATLIILVISIIFAFFTNCLLGLFFESKKIINEAMVPFWIDLSVMWVEALGLNL